MKVIRLHLFGIEGNECFSSLCVSASLRFSSFLCAVMLVFGVGTLTAAEDVTTSPQPLALAEELFQATLFAEAIRHYEAVIRKMDASGSHLTQKSCMESYATVTSRLGQAHFFLDSFAIAYDWFKRAAEAFESFPCLQQGLAEESNYYFALTCRHLKHHSQALEILKSLLQSQNRSIKAKVLFEIGLNHFLLGELPLAKEQFLSLERDDAANLPFSMLAQLYLSRISMAEKAFLEARTRLDTSEKLIAKDSRLHFELAYLQGETAFHLYDFKNAIQYFENALPTQHQEEAEWYGETLYHLGWSHLKLADTAFLNSAEQLLHFKRAECCFTELLGKSSRFDGLDLASRELLINEKDVTNHSYISSERVYLAMAQCYLTKGARLKDEAACAKAEELLSRSECFISPEAKTYALLLKAEAVARVALMSPQPSTSTNASALFLQAAEGFGKAYQSLQIEDSARATLAFKHQIQAYQRCNSQQGLEKALALMKNFLNVHSEGMVDLNEPQELFYLYGMIACRLAEENEACDALAENAERVLRAAVEAYPNGNYVPDCLNLLAIFYLRKEQFLQAEATFLSLVDLDPHSPYSAAALYWSAHCAEKLGKDDHLVQGYKKRLFENYSNSPFAATAYFHYYSYRQYLQGDRAAMKHLQAFKNQFPEAPLQIAAYYLIGLDYKRERKSAEGRSLRKKNHIKAISNFFKAETLFDHLYHQQMIPEDQMNYYVMIRYRSLLERALSNQAVAEDSHATKRAIYSQYAHELFTQINRELADQSHPLACCLTKKHAFSKLQQESLYLLVLNYIKSEDFKAANQTIEKILARYAYLNITKGYYLSLMHYEEGMIAMRLKNFDAALKAFLLAEESNQACFLSVDQKLNLWIQQSMCYKALNQTDHAMLILSKAINDNTISSLRVKAMYLRAKIYTLQGRHELARKQLEATAKKGGEWAVKAKLKLDNDYGF